MDKFKLLVEEQRTAYYQFLECHSPQRITSKHSDSTQSKESWRNLCTAPNGTSYYIIPSDDPMFHRFKDVAVTIDFCSCLELFKSPRFKRVRQRICIPIATTILSFFIFMKGDVPSQLTDTQNVLKAEISASIIYRRCTQYFSMTKILLASTLS